MKVILNWVKNNPNRFMFLIPILLVAAISISHVVTWYDIANPINWAIYLSIAIEIGAMTALVAATNQIKGGVWFMFGLVTFIQMIGNIFYSYTEIDETGELFLSWVELTGPIWESLGTELTDTVGLKRYLAYLEGGLLPIISLTSLHFFVKYEKKELEGVTDKEGYFNSRNKHIEKVVSDNEGEGIIITGDELGNIVEPYSPEDVQQTPIDNEVTDITVTDEVKESFPTPSNSQVTTKDIKDESSNDEISERMDDRMENYINDENVPQPEDKPPLEEVVKEQPEDKPTEEIEKQIIDRDIVKQPLKPSKTKISRIE
jgi:hypothetical protein